MQKKKNIGNIFMCLNVETEKKRKLSANLPPVTKEKEWETLASVELTEDSKESKIDKYI